MKKHLAVLFVLAISAVCSAKNTDNVIFIYNTTAFVQEIMRVDVKKGDNSMTLQDMPYGLQADSLFFESSKKDILKNVSFRFLPPDDQSRQEKSRVRVFVDDKALEGTLESDNGQDIVIKAEAKKAYRVNREKISYMEIMDYKSPDNGQLNEIEVDFESKEGGKADIRANYFLSGITWSAVYSFYYDENRDKAKIECRANINNGSGRQYKASKLFVISGDVNKQFAYQPYPARPMAKAAFAAEAMGSAADSAAPAQVAELADFYEYEIKGIYDLEKNAVRAVNLIEQREINVKKEYVYDSGINTDAVLSRFTFMNDENSNLGITLPSGKISMFIEKDGNLHFIGEDTMKDTPKNEKIELTSGKVFDIKAERKTRSSEKISDKIWEETYEIKFSNRKDTDVTISGKERITGGYWEIRSADFDYKKKENDCIEFSVKLKPEEIKTLKYTVRKRW